jgi:hypothetical protein
VESGAPTPETQIQFSEQFAPWYGSKQGALAISFPPLPFPLLPPAHLDIFAIHTPPLPFDQNLFHKRRKS